MNRKAMRLVLVCLVGVMAGLCGKLVIDYRQKQRAAAISGAFRGIFKTDPEEAARIEARLAKESAEEQRLLDAAAKRGR